MENKKFRQIYSSVDGGYTYKDYCECCEDNGRTPAREDSDAYYNWLSDQIVEDWDCLLANIKYSKNNGRCIITGTLGLWWGHPEIEAVVCDSLVEAIKKCNENDYIEVFENEEDGSVEVHSIHHDGTNIFNIYPINKRAARLSNNEVQSSKNILYYAGKYPKYLY